MSFTFVRLAGSLFSVIAMIDTNIWGFLAVPVGVTLCFGPALAFWIKKEYLSGPENDEAPVAVRAEAPASRKER